MSEQWYCVKCGPVDVLTGVSAELGYCPKCEVLRATPSIPPFVTAMQEEIASLRHDIDRHVAIAAEQATRIAGLEKDAMRYRYWRDNHGWTGTFDDGASNSEDAADIDAAIEAAMGAG